MENVDMKRVILVLVLIAGLSTLPAKEVSKVGTTAARFLNIDTGGRGVAMGGACVSVVDDASAMYWNPSCIGLFDGPCGYFSHTRWIMDVTVNYAAVALPVRNIGTLGINAKFLTMDEMERTTVNQPDGTGEMFDAASYALGLSFARSLTDRFAIGFTGKYINERIYHSSAHGVAFDVGTVYTTTFNNLKIGMSITNYGTKMNMTGRDLLVQHDISDLIEGNNPNINATLNTGSYDIPLLFRFGISMDILQHMQHNQLILAVDALHPNDDKESVNVGMEYGFHDLFFLRAGFKSLFLPHRQEGLTAGAGFVFRVPGMGEMQLDYAYQDTEWFDAFQHFSLSYGF